MFVAINIDYIKCPKCGKGQCSGKLASREESGNEKQYHGFIPEAFECVECKTDFMVTASIIVDVEPIEAEVQHQPDLLCCNQCNKYFSGQLRCPHCGSGNYEIVAQ